MKAALNSEPTQLGEHDLNRPYLSIEDTQRLFEDRGFEVTVQRQKPEMTQALYLKSEWKQLNHSATPLVYRPQGQKEYFLTDHGKELLNRKA